MKPSKIFLICLLFSLTFIYSFSQNRVIRGSVADNVTGEKLPGVNVIEVNQNDRVINGTITDFNGEFIIQLHTETKSIRFSFIGYKSIDIEIGNQTYMDVKLEAETKQLEEVKVVGNRLSTNGFMPVSIRETSASISKIEMNDIGQLGSTSVEEALTGKLSGVDISMASGDPGASISIQIRGASSLNGKNEPLILVNGVIYETTIQDDFQFASATADDYGNLVDIAPQDIESIEIYKDAAATAMYGPKAANGVLAITTKKGKRGAPIVTYSYKKTWDRAPDPIPLLNGPDYVLMQLDAQYNRAIDLTGAPPDITGEDFYPILYKTKNDYQYAWEHSQNTDWVKAVTQGGIKTDQSFSISGGGDKATYRVSLNYLTSDGTTIGTGFDRLTSRLNLDYRLSNHLRFTSEVALTNSKKYDNVEIKVDQNNDGTKTTQTTLGLAYRKAPNMSIYEMLGPDSASNEYFAAYYNSTYNNHVIQNYQGWGDEGYYNPVAMINDGGKTTASNRVLTNLGLDYEIIPGKLKFQTNIAYDIDNKNISQFTPQSATGVMSYMDDYNITYHKSQEQYTIQNTSKFVYTQTFKEVHNIIAVAGFTVESLNSISQVGQGVRSPSLNITTFTSDSPIKDIDTDLGRYREAGYILNLIYKYKDKFTINPGFRIDGSSSYGLGNKWGFRPLISMAYFPSKEPFMQGMHWINDLKLRASYGTIGKNPDNNINETYGLYQNSDKYYIGSDDGVERLYSGVEPQNIQLYNLKWELVTKYNAGIDLYAFNNRLSATLEYYTDITSGILQKDYKIPVSTGYDKLKWYNSGIVENSGLEFQTNTKVIESDDFGMDLDFNFTINRNKIIKVPDNITETSSNMLENGNYASLIVEGGGVHSYYGYIYDGVFATDQDAIARDSEGKPLLDIDGNPLYLRFNNAGGYVFKAGDAKYRDINYDGLINEADIVQLGKPYPDFHGGFGLNFTFFKVFSIRTSFHYKVGHDIVNQTKMLLENMYDKSNQAVSVNRRWRQAGDQTDIPRALYNSGYNWLGSSRFVEDASFLKFQFISFSYKLPKKYLKKFVIKDLDFFLSVYNVYTFTNYTGQNPEVDVASKDVNYIGIDDSKTPVPREISGGFNIKF